MTTVSCIVITTLVVVSLANLLLLVHFIMHSMNKCESSRLSVKKFPKINRRDLSKTSATNYKFATALMLLVDDDFDFVCGVAVVSKKWVLTAAHCVEPVLNQKINAKITQLGNGVLLDVEDIVVHEEYPSVDRNVALVSIRQNFKEKEVVLLPLPKKGYRYLADSNATLFSWVDDNVVATSVRLLEHKNCEIIYGERISGATFCGEKKGCLVDSGGFLVQKGVLVGVTTLGVGCGTKPVVYTKFLKSGFRSLKSGLDEPRSLRCSKIRLGGLKHTSVFHKKL